jgi:hypothetical protein
LDFFGPNKIFFAVSPVFAPRIFQKTHFFILPDMLGGASFQSLAVFSLSFEMYGYLLGMKILCLFSSLLLLLPVVYSATVEDLTLSLNSDELSYTITGCSSTAYGNLDIPSQVNGKPITSIGYSAFSNCDLLTSIVIPETVINIGAAAFKFCASLKNVEINGLIQSINASTFYFSTNLENVSLPNSVRKIDNSSFSGCYKLSNITFPENLEEIGGRAFSNCNTFTSIQIPNGVHSIGESAFLSCDNLISVDLPTSLSALSSNSFQYCSSLTYISIPESVSVIGLSAFKRCDELIEVRILGDLDVLGDDAFLDCSKLEKIYLDGVINSFMGAPFYGISSDAEIIVTNSDNLNYYGSSFAGISVSADEIIFQDSDNDLLYDHVETNTGLFISESNTGTNPNAFDSDGDGLSDYDEIYIHNSDPNNSDTDNDGISDSLELAIQSNPLVESNEIVNLLNSEGFYKTSEIIDVRPGSTMIEVSENQATVQLQMEESSDLQSWEATGTPATMTIPADAETKFFRFKMAE